MSDLVERMARTFYEAGAEYWAQHNQTLPEWKDVYPETKEALFAQMRSVKMLVRKETLEEAAKVKAMQWQPIETAPKDGRPILVWAPNKDPEKVEWNNHPECNYWSLGLIGPCFDCNHLYYEPTRWMPILPPPEDASDEPSEGIETYYARQIDWSRTTFGPALRTKGLLDHITKELREIASSPHDLSEWIDVVILAMDGFWRHGGKPEDLMPALLAKQKKNMARKWPDWRGKSEDGAIEHDRSGESGTALQDKGDGSGEGKADE